MLLYFGIEKGKNLMDRKNVLSMASLFILQELYFVFGLFGVSNENR